METLFELEDQYQNSLKDFEMNVDYALAYLTTDEQEVNVLTGTASVGKAEYDPATLPSVPANFKCSRLTTNVQCQFYAVDQTDREIYNATPTDQKITAQKKKITAAQRALRVQSKTQTKLQEVIARFGAQS